MNSYKIASKERRAWTHEKNYDYGNGAEKWAVRKGCRG